MHIEGISSITVQGRSNDCHGQIVSTVDTPSIRSRTIRLPICTVVVPGWKVLANVRADAYEIICKASYIIPQIEA